MKRKLNIKLLRKIQQHIVVEPRCFTMSTYYCKVAKEESPCGTVACIAGWALLLSRKHIPKVRSYISDGAIAQRAAMLLGLDASYCPDDLFIAPSWPKRFLKAYMNAKTKRTEARVAVQRIEHLIKTGK